MATRSMFLNPSIGVCRFMLFYLVCPSLSAIFCLSKGGTHLRDWIDSLPWGVAPRSSSGVCRVRVPPVVDAVEYLLQELELDFFAGQVVAANTDLFVSYDLRCLYRGICGRILTVSSSDVNHLELAYIYFVATGQGLYDVAGDASVFSPVRNHTEFCLGGQGVSYGPESGGQPVQCVPVVRVDFVLVEVHVSSHSCSRFVRHRTLMITDDSRVADIE